MASTLLEKPLDGESLVMEYCQTGNHGLKEPIVSAYLPLVKHIVGRIALSPNSVLSREDLMQFGLVGLLKALDRYQPDLKAAFGSFAYRRIHGEVIDAVRQEGLISRHKYDKIKKLEKTIQKLRGELGREPLALEICEEMEIDIDEYHEIVDSAQLCYTESLESPVTNSDGETVYRIDLIQDQLQMTPEDTVVLENLKLQLRKTILGLPERERLVIALYFTENLTLSDIGQVIGLTEARVSQILNQTLLNIRVVLNK
ncbi:MAG TPA: FliA/WhiG family RNA polymerase sigma factor [Calditrichia bacterium]|nr:FliA/WhiG family RNA polymerase sigma factor [Calditrichota bacterium]HQU70663.1 FliA/WhiG family RNA polymerase sigma factor [Calditrichia bacterium]HQV33028.1 FliA/WhiG family RNA polymerase sigma factor [Calditrichia bacterium]